MPRPEVYLSPDPSGGSQPSQPNLSPRQARKARRQESFDAAKQQGVASLSRRILFGAIAEVAVTAYVAGKIVLNTSPRNEALKPAEQKPATAILRPKDLQTDTDERVIERRVQEMGIQPSRQENSLWLKGYSHDEKKLPVDETTYAEANRRVNMTFNLMLQSENLWLKEKSAAFLKQLVSEGTVSIGVSPIPPSGQDKSAAGVYGIERDGKFHMVISINQELILNDSNSSSLAFVLAHEAEHVRNELERQKALINLPVAERVKISRERPSRDVNGLVEEEARGYAVQAEAFTYHYGLGYRGGGPHDKAMAAAYIRYGNNASDPRWIERVRKDEMDTSRLILPTPTGTN